MSDIQGAEPIILDDDYSQRDAQLARDIPKSSTETLLEHVPQLKIALLAFALLAFVLYLAQRLYVYRKHASAQRTQQQYRTHSQVSRKLR